MRKLTGFLLASFWVVVAAAQDVKVNLEIGRTFNDKNVIVYDRNRPLKISDFKGKPDKRSPGVAGTYAGFALGYGYKESKGEIVLNIVLTSVFYTRQSWFKDHAKDEYMLNHEQRHFDLATAITCEMADSIRNTRFSARNFNKELANLQNHFQKLLNERQQQYDDATNHGIEKEEQALWNKKIDEMLGRENCY